MRVLSVPQPFAHLIARREKRYEVRTWGTAYRGRIAIHASAAVPAFQLIFDAERDPKLRRAFDFQGWKDRDALLRLPRSAIVATADLVNVLRGNELNDAADLVGELEGSEYLWELADVVEIEPVAGVTGKQNLWTLPEEVAAAVREAEASARAFAAANPRPEAEHSRSVLARLDANEAFWQDMRQGLPRPRIVPERKQPRKFKWPAFESLFGRMLARYLATHRVRDGREGKEVHVDHRLEGMRLAFGTREWVPEREFEARLRAYLERFGDYGADAVDADEWADVQLGVEDYEALDAFRGLDKFFELEGGKGEAIVDGYEEQPRHEGRLRPWLGDELQLDDEE
jgi:hypothetical protein